jgi:hypothetical protein
MESRKLRQEVETNLDPQGRLDTAAPSMSRGRYDAIKRDGISSAKERKKERKKKGKTFISVE